LFSNIPKCGAYFNLKLFLLGWIDLFGLITEFAIADVPVRRAAVAVAPFLRKDLLCISALFGLSKNSYSN